MNNLLTVPLPYIARHEAGHALMAQHVGLPLHFIVYGRAVDGSPFGLTKYQPGLTDAEILVKSAGIISLFLADSSTLSLDAFAKWLDDNPALVMSARVDWNQILMAREIPTEGLSTIDLSFAHLDYAIEPYFDETAAILNSRRADLDALTSLLIANPPGIGPRAAKCFFAGSQCTWWDQLLDAREVRRGCELALRSESTFRRL